jgi:hypothetical protein
MMCVLCGGGDWESVSTLTGGKNETSAVEIVLTPRQCIGENKISRQGGNLVTMQMTRPAILFLKN